MKPILAIVTASALLSLTPCLRAGEEDELPARVEALQQKARAARDAGRIEDAEKLQAEMQQLQKKAGEFQREARMQEMKAMLDKTQAELAEAEKTGNEQAAAQARQRLERLKAALTEHPRDGRPGNDHQQPDPPRGDAGPRPEGGNDRLNHLRQAIEHLHAAGMHDVADRIANDAHKFAGGPSEKLVGDRRPEGDRGPEGDRRPGGGGEIQELRQAIRQMQGQIQELSRRLGELGQRGR